MPRQDVLVWNKSKEPPMDQLQAEWPGFTFLNPDDRLKGQKVLPDAAGLYLIAFAEGSDLPVRARNVVERLPKAEGGYSVLYVGETLSNRRRRVNTHIGGSTWCSTFRKTAGLLMADHLDLAVSMGWGGLRNFDFGLDGDRRLDEWLKAEAVVGYRVLEDPRDEERRLIAERPPLLNITGRRLTEEGRRKAKMRQDALPFRPRRQMRRVSNNRKRRQVLALEGASV